MVNHWIKIDLLVTIKYVTKVKESYEPSISTCDKIYMNSFVQMVTLLSIPTTNYLIVGKWETFTN